MSAWISVNDRLPETTGDVLAYFSGEGIVVAFFDPGETRPWWHELTTADAWETPTHWQPLPAPPKDR